MASSERPFRSCGSLLLSLWIWFLQGLFEPRNLHNPTWNTLNQLRHWKWSACSIPEPVLACGSVLLWLQSSPACSFLSVLLSDPFSLDLSFSHFFLKDRQASSSCCSFLSKCLFLLLFSYFSLICLDLIFFLHNPVFSRMTYSNILVCVWWSSVIHVKFMWPILISWFVYGEEVQFMWNSCFEFE